MTQPKDFDEWLLDDVRNKRIFPRSQIPILKQRGIPIEPKDACEICEVHAMKEPESACEGCPFYRKTKEKVIFI